MLSFEQSNLRAEEASCKDVGLTVNLSGKRTVYGHNSGKTLDTSPKEQYSVRVESLRLVTEEDDVFCRLPFLMYKNGFMVKVIHLFEIIRKEVDEMLVMNIIEICGTIAFAISGALVAMKKDMDFFGVMILSGVTAIGGGILRDLLVGNVPPTAIMKPFYSIIIIITVLCIFVFYDKFHFVGKIIFLFDAAGLGAFTAMGAAVAIQHEVSNLFMVILLGTITGVGGGIIRDVLANEIPVVLRKEIYAVASIVGSVLFYFIYYRMGLQTAMYVCTLTTFFIRVLTKKYDIHLPVMSRELSKGQFETAEKC